MLLASDMAFPFSFWCQATTDIFRVDSTLLLDSQEADAIGSFALSNLFLLGYRPTGSHDFSSVVWYIPKWMVCVPHDWIGWGMVRDYSSFMDIVSLTSDL